jgi:hypothetical protein
MRVSAQARQRRLPDKTYRHNREPPVPPSFGLLSPLPMFGPARKLNFLLLVNEIGFR